MLVKVIIVLTFILTCHDGVLLYENDSACQGVFTDVMFGARRSQPSFINRHTIREAADRGYELVDGFYCNRKCKVGAKPRICYYRFYAEDYPVLGTACLTKCKPGAHLPIRNTCQCVLLDGRERVYYTINRMFPGPNLITCLGDIVVVDVANGIQGAELTIHWHGILHKGTQYSDGVPFITQCPIFEGNSYRYYYVTDEEGTYFYHSHTGLQKAGGLSGPIIVRLPYELDVNKDEYDCDDNDHVIMVNDVLPGNPSEFFPGTRIVNRGQSPDNIVINGRGVFTYKNGTKTKITLPEFVVQPGKRSRFRFINGMSTSCSIELKIQGHSMKIIACDSIPVRPTYVDSFVTLSVFNLNEAERVDFVIEANNTNDGTYYMEFKTINCESQLTQVAILRYAGYKKIPSTSQTSFNHSVITGVDLIPFQAEKRNNSITYCELTNKHKNIDVELINDPNPLQIYTSFGLFTYNNISEFFHPGNYQNFIMSPTGVVISTVLRNISFVSPTSPLLSQHKDVDPKEFCDKCSSSTPCHCTHLLNIPINRHVELIFYGEQPITLQHPLHLHGYSPYVVGMGSSKELNVDTLSEKILREADAQGKLNRRRCDPDGSNCPIQKDTISTPHTGYLILRINTNNPGYWLFHCHFGYHTAAGMVMVLRIGDQNDLPPIPAGQPRCGNFAPNVFQSLQFPVTNN